MMLERSWSIKVAVKVYLAGPIFMCDDSDANDWRTRAKLLLHTSLTEFKCLDPMIRDYRNITDIAYREIVDLDKIDVRTCDIVLANCTQPSAGTSMEIFYAHQLGKIVVPIVSGQPSPWIKYHSTTIQPSLESAIEWILDTGITVL